MKRCLVLLLVVGCEVEQADLADDAGVKDAGIVDEPRDAGFAYTGEIIQARSLVWTQSEIVDDPDVVGLARVTRAAAERFGQSEGVLFDAWLRRFATTPHSERAGPAQLAEQLAETLGSDAATWDLNDVPFKVTAVHNRIDLFRRAEHCGELRVSLASTDPILRPFHIIFLFRMPDDGTGCSATALRWAELSALQNDEFLDAARALLDEGFTADRFLIAESVELTVSPWEWRQWTFDGAQPENPPLFQQVDVSRLNQPGALRDAFLTFVDDNAAALEARTMLIPDRFRAPSTRVSQGVPWVPLDLEGRSTTLRQNIEIIGCAACHTADAEFVHTREDRTFSPFYTKELRARAALLPSIVDGTAPHAPFGPLQEQFSTHP